MRIKYEKNLTVMLISLPIVLLGIGGWVANVVKLVGSSFDPLTGMVVARAIGVFIAPLGSVLGFL